MPPAETNPLSNPLLRDNLRRWAEVYFGTAPEHREQAVQELVHHLERESDSNQAGTGTGFAEPGNASATSVETSELVRCNVCGHHNARSQRFCGMCGSEAFSLDQRPRTQLERVPEQTWNLDRGPGEPENEAGHWHSESDAPPSVPTNSELSLFQDVPRREPDYDDPDFQYESSSSQPYRFLIGLVLAVMFAGLGYMAWRGTQGTQPHQVSPPPPAAVAPETAAAPSESRQPAAPEPTAPPVKNPAEPPAARNTPAANKTAPVKDSSRKESDTEAASPEPAKAATAPDTSGKGTEELSIAERYLSGASGERRNTAEASKWLWRSVAKHNDQASVLLADLYLRGDGVLKNCDQARVLLDSAARKGVFAAGERLRNLQAFGCQ